MNSQDEKAWAAIMPQRYNRYAVFFSDGSGGFAMALSVEDAIAIAHEENPGARALAIFDGVALYQIEFDEDNE